MTTKKLYDLEEVRQIIPLSKPGIYKACSEGKIPTVKVGKRIFVPGWYIEEIVSKPAGV